MAQTRRLGPLSRVPTLLLVALLTWSWLLVLVSLLVLTLSLLLLM